MRWPNGSCAKRVRTTRPDLGLARHPDLVKRDFAAVGRNQLWVTDLTFVPTWPGFAYVGFIIDAYSRMIVGWRVASHMRTTMVLDAIEMARWSRGTRLAGLRCHSDAGSGKRLRHGRQLVGFPSCRREGVLLARTCRPDPTDHSLRRATKKERVISPPVAVGSRPARETLGR